MYPFNESDKARAKKLQAAREMIAFLTKSARIDAIKALRVVTGAGLWEAKTVVDEVVKLYESMTGVEKELRRDLEGTTCALDAVRKDAVDTIKELKGRIEDEQARCKELLEEKGMLQDRIAELRAELAKHDIDPPAWREPLGKSEFVMDAVDPAKPGDHKVLVWDTRDYTWDEVGSYSELGNAHAHAQREITAEEAPADRVLVVKVEYETETRRVLCRRK